MKGKSLVCQFLENISAAALEKYKSIIQEYTHSRHGIYALYRDKRIYYVGLARSLRGRLRQHLRDRHKGLWNRFSVYLTIGDGHMKELESLLLRIVKPSGNRVSGKFSRAENLKRKFRRDLVNFHKVEIREVLCDDDVTPEVVERLKPRGLGKYLDGRSRKLRVRYKGRTLRAIARKDGMIRFKGKVYGSPSAAAKAAVTHGGEVDGWAFWFFERAPGDWVRLDELRHRRRR